MDKKSQFAQNDRDGANTANSRYQGQKATFGLANNRMAHMKLQIHSEQVDIWYVLYTPCRFMSRLRAKVHKENKKLPDL